MAVNQLWDVTNPPKPETYVEHQLTGGHDAGGSSGGGRRSGMIGSLLKSDANNDGVLTLEEVPSQFKAAFPRVDLNSDGKLDTEELDWLYLQFKGSKASLKEGRGSPFPN